MPTAHRLLHPGGFGWMQSCRKREGPANRAIPQVKPATADDTMRSDQLMLWERKSKAAVGCRSGKGEGQKAGAQQHEARRGEGQKSAGNDIVVAHGSPATLDAGPN